MIYWYEGYCKNCGKIVRGRILDGNITTVDVAEDKEGWFDKDSVCEKPFPEILEIRDCE